jgi:hypothetical protein
VSKALASELAGMFEECIDAIEPEMSHLPEQSAKDVCVKALVAVLCNVHRNGMIGRKKDIEPGAADAELAHRLMTALNYSNPSRN